MKIIRESARIDPTKFGSFGYGGSNRTIQIEEFLRSTVGVEEIEDLDFSQKTSIKERITAFWQLIVKDKFRIKPSKWLVSWTCARYVIYSRKFKDSNKIAFFLLEEPPSFISYHAARTAGIKVIAFPHNIETMVSKYTTDFFTKENFPIPLFREISYLKQADLIICISREEQWLLNAFGIKALYLPYLPPSKKYEYYSSIRKLRSATTYNKANFLIVGTTNNIPTLKSMENQLELLSEVSKNFSFQVTLVGYGTEKLQEMTDRFPFVKLEGTVDNTRLEELLVQSEAVLIHQDEGVGALTKIPEYLIAGVPVIANNHAARSAFHLDGLLVYDSIEELSYYMTAEKKVPSIPEISSRNIDNIKKLIWELIKP